MAENRKSRASDARLIIPAPADTRTKTNILWYEAELSPPSRSVDMIGYRADKLRVAAMQAVLEADDRVTGTFVDVGIRLAIEVNIRRDTASNVLLDGTVNDKEFRLATEDHASVRPKLTSEEARVLSSWAPIIEVFDPLVQATRNSWGCGACALVGAGVVVAGGACIAGAVPACATALIGGGTIVEHCIGACHHLIRRTPEPVYIELG